MRHFSDDCVGYGGEQAKLLFPQAKGKYIPEPSDLYWKITLAVPNIELACQQLKELGVDVGAPRQFLDVGYLAHFTDPEGFTIELIEHWFQGQRGDEHINPDLLGGGAHLNLLTLRANSIGNIITLCESWGMKQLCIQTLESHGFTLYFFAFTSDSPPSLDLYAVENREWLYQRKYTVLEVQYLHKEVEIQRPHSAEAGYAGTVFSGFTENIRKNELFVTTLKET